MSNYRKDGKLRARTVSFLRWYVVEFAKFSPTGFNEVRAGFLTRHEAVVWFDNEFRGMRNPNRQFGIFYKDELTFVEEGK